MNTRTYQNTSKSRKSADPGQLKLKLKMIPYIIRTHNELVLGGGVVRASDPARCSWRKTPPPIAS